MKIWTWGEMRTKIENDLDLTGENFVSSAELIGYVNDAIDACEQIFMGINDLYFETQAYLPLVSGTDTYPLPSDIYATKLTLVQYDDGSVKYRIKRLKDKAKITYVQSDQDYMYRLVNSAASGLKMKFYPTSRETSSTNVTLHYIRSANRVVDDTTQIDMPEAAKLIMQFVKDRIKDKERGTVGSEPSPALITERDLLLATLSDMVEDEDTTIPPDLEIYWDMDLGH